MLVCVGVDVRREECVGVRREECVGVRREEWQRFHSISQN